MRCGPQEQEAEGRLLQLQARACTGLGAPGSRGHPAVSRARLGQGPCPRGPHGRGPPLWVPARAPALPHPSPQGTRNQAGRVAHLQGGGPRPASPERTGRTRAGSYVTPAPASGRRSPGAEPGRAARASQNATRRVSAAQAWPRPRRPPPPHCHVRRRNARGARIAGPISRPRGRTPAGRSQSRAEEGVGATDQSEVEERALSRGEPIDGRQTVRARASRPIAGEDVGATRNSAASGPTSR